MGEGGSPHGKEHCIMPKYRRGSGSVYKKRGVFYIAYYTPDGQHVCESARTKDKAEARRVLQARLGQLAEGRYVGPAAERVTFEELIEAVRRDFLVNKKKTLGWVERRVRLHLAPFFGGKKAHDITTSDVQAFVLQRQQQNASNGEINRELIILRRAFNLGLQAEKITRKPHVLRLEENNVRQGFFEPWEFAAVLAKLPECLRSPFTFAYHTGWRLLSEVLPLTWQQVDREEGTVRLEPGTTKNKEGRLIYLTQELYALIQGQWREHEMSYPHCPFVFHDYGRRIANYYKRWHGACQGAGLVGKIPHDFRRTAVRNMVRAGIPERVAMQMSGHKTRSIFDRYHIVSEGDLREAAKRLDGAFPAQITTLSTTLAGIADSVASVSH
jgi:integrase